MGCSLATGGTLTEVVVEPDMRFTDPHWYAVYTRSRHEQVVKKQLDGKEIESFLPLYEKISQWKDRKKVIALPLFPGYLFVRIPLRERIEVLKTFGAVNIVGNAQGPLPIPEGQIQSIQSFIRGGLRLDPHPYLKLGSRVRIAGGPFDGVEGILIRKKNQTRLVVSVDLIQRSVSVEFDSWKIQRV